MKIETQNYNSVTVIEIKGEMTAESIKSFQDTASNVLAGKATKKIVLDMTGVGFIDSVGLEHLLWFQDSCRENQRQLKLAGLEESCEKILEVTRLASQFDIYAELAEAVKSFV